MEPALSLLTNLVVPSNRSRRPARRERICFHNQCEHWLWKQYHKSVSRPEIPQDFMAHAVFFLRVEKPPGGFSTP